jgi:Ni/Fe-hydrogenase subunit HybB-like protein
MTPDVLGEVYAYNPSLNEVMVGAGVWGVGALVFTLMVKVAMAINAGEFRDESALEYESPMRTTGLAPTDWRR